MLDFGVERVSVPSSFLFEVVGDVHFGGFSKLFLYSKLLFPILEVGVDP